MQCDICIRSEGHKLPFCCTTCARNSLYDLRLKNAQTLLHKETLGRQVQAATGSTSAWTATGDAVKASRIAGQDRERAHQWAYQTASCRQDEVRGRRQESLAHIENLRREIETGKADIARRKAILAQRRSHVLSATRGLTERRAGVLDTLASGVSETRKRWDAMHSEIVKARVFLCTEAADLYGLRQRTRKKGGSIRDDYTIGGIGIIDLRDLNSASPIQITVSMSRLAHLLVLTSHYLSLRLPAEITLPHRDYPGATIFSPRSSYTSMQVPFPGSTPSHSSNVSPSASRNGDLHALPRPRPLYLNKKLPVLAKEDPVNYSLFVEGVTLLAWDIAWLCWTQGLHVSSNSWEDICALGKNLWQLLAEVPQLRSISKASSSNDTGTTPSKGPTSHSEPQKESYPRASLGEYSHGSARSYLGGAKETELMQGWKFQSPVKVIDKVKSMLLGELAGAEWEILDEREFESVGRGAEDEEAVLVGGARTAAGPAGNERPETDAVAMPTSGDQVPRDDGTGGGGMAKGTSGWTKLKSRGT